MLIRLFDRYTSSQCGAAQYSLPPTLWPYFHMQAQADALWALLHPGTALVFVPLIPAAYVIFGIFLSATMCAAKWTILGRAKLGVHR